MLKKLAYLCLLIIGISSCDCTYQYAVLVKNSTGENLTIAYKSLNDVRGEIEETIVMKNGESKFIINTTDISVDDKCDGTSQEHSKHVAEYIRASIKDGMACKINWYDERFSFAKTDIQQAEFTIEYTLDDF